MATVPPSIKVAFAQANALWPARSRASDGTVGDARHASNVSDHNPDGRGVVHAFDLTHDPAHGVDCNALADLLVRRIVSGAEFRVKYLIWSKKVFNPSRLMTWRPYSGSNPHTKHMHVSILPGSGAENDTSPWWTPTGGTPPTTRVSSETKPPPFRRVESLEVDVILSRYEVRVTTDSEGRGWVKVDVPWVRVHGFTAPSLRPALPPDGDGRYLVGQVGLTEEGQGTVVSVTEWEPNAEAVVGLSVAG